MRLGTRWTSGDTPPNAVPAVLHDEIARVDASVVVPGGAPRPAWTLTWLEGRPVAELATGVVVSQSAGGEVVVGQIDDDTF